MFLKYIFISWPVTICLLIFTIVYLQIVFLGLWRKKSERRITFNDEASVSALDTIMHSADQEDTVYIAITLCLIVAYVILMISIKIMEQLRNIDDEM